MSSIILENIGKSYDKLVALDSVSFSVSEGELFGLIGPDGAGKSTLFRIIATLTLPDTGKGSMLGLDIVKSFREIRNVVGYMPGKFSLYQDLSVEENLQFYASLFGVTVKENYDLIAPIYEQLAPFSKRRAGKLSGGMKQKLALCCALIHKPRILLLDEPTTGVDAVSRSEFWSILADIKQRGITIVVSTPYMDEAMRCDRVALMNKGVIMKIDTPTKLIDDYQEVLYSVRDERMFRLLTYLREDPTIESSYPFGDSHHFVVNSDFDEAAFIAGLTASGFERAELARIKAGIEDVFIKLMSDE